MKVPFTGQNGVVGSVRGGCGRVVEYTDLRKAWDEEVARKEALDERRAECHAKTRPDMPSLAISGIQLVPA